MRSRFLPRMAAPILASLLLFSACGRPATTSTSHPATPTPPPSVTPLPTQPPVPTVAVIQSGGAPVQGKTAYWSHANLPAGFGMLFHDSDLQVAASDGKTAYSCGVPSGATTPRVIVTHDAGGHWQATAPIAASWGACDRVVVDQLNPSIVIAESCCSPGPAAISRDGGASWRALPSADQHIISQIATIGSKTWGLVSVPITNGISFILGESDDGMQTWREIDGTLSGENLRWFWINPGNGALLLQEFNTGLWQSDDDGATWRHMDIPTSNAVDYAVQQPIANQPWRLCASYYPSQDSSSVAQVCTTNGGNSWFQPPSVPDGQMVGIANDGALLASNRSFMVFRLPQGATRWQMLGAAPQAGCCIHFVPASSGGGVLWKFPAESDGAAISDKPNDVYYAAYPY